MNKKLLVLSAVLFVLFAGFTYCINKVDVASVSILPAPGVEAEAETVEIGFAKLNLAMRDALGFNELFYKSTTLLGYAAVALCVVFACLGLYQWITRKSLKNVDPEIIILGVVFVIALAIYFAFDYLALNFRPWILDAEEGLDASYPSSHTILGMVGFLCGIRLANTYLPKKLKGIATALLIILPTLITVGRIFSGAHWITDFAGALLVSGAIVTLFYGLVGKRKQKENTDEN